MGGVGANGGSPRTISAWERVVGANGGSPNYASSLAHLQKGVDTGGEGD